MKFHNDTNRSLRKLYTDSPEFYTDIHISLKSTVEGLLLGSLINISASVVEKDHISFQWRYWFTSAPTFIANARCFII